MTQELDKRQENGFSQEQIDIIRKQVAPEGTTNDELALFLTYCYGFIVRSETGCGWCGTILAAQRRERGE